MTHLPFLAIAQRRPGPKPRRQPQSWQQPGRGWPAQRRPGPKPRRQSGILPQLSELGSHAQRRPGPKPRRQSPPMAANTRREGFGAQRRPGPKPRRQQPGRPRSRRERPPLNEGRGRNPGDSIVGCKFVTYGRSLNEGRGRNPGDSRRGRQAIRSSEDRSTKAGAETPATVLIRRQAGYEVKS